jgi:hypothetical protein
LRRDPVEVLGFIALCLVVLWLGAYMVMCQLDKMDRRECRTSGGAVIALGEDEWRCQR